ncbi:MAG: hypothetical protein ACTHMC_07350 [Pseudobacter sp.]|uniref:hypothetical protein n=1 Tax=Pseudobacter sp. TaxID=2045420 RepID=UPI003F80E95F
MQTQPGTSENMKDPFRIIAEFCRNYHQHEVQSMLWEWLSTAISRTHSIYDDGKERASLILLYENITLLIAAAYSVHHKTAAASTAPSTNITKNKKSGPPKP